MKSMNLVINVQGIESNSFFDDGHETKGKATYEAKNDITEDDLVVSISVLLNWILLWHVTHIKTK